MRELSSRTRRRVLQGIAGGLGVGAASAVGGHPSDDHPSEDGEHDIHEHHVTKNAELVGYHSLADVGSESESGRPEDAMHGVVSETWVEGDYAFVSFLSSSEPHGNRGVAVVDVSRYTRADSVEEMREAEMEVVSFIGNETEAGTGADVKVSDDGQYLAYSKQAIGATYGNAASPSTDVHDAPGAMPLGVEVYDVSDPEDPRYLGTGQGPNVGFHNCFVHEIGGDHYVFGVQGAVPGDAGVHVFRIHEEGGVEPVNFWSGGDLAQGEYESNAVEYYCHDFYAHDDPETGRPLGYVSYWNYGLQVIDLSDPTDIEELGVGDLPRTHYAQPAPVLLGDGDERKRVFVGGQEHGSQVDEVSGYVRIFDGDGIFDDGVSELPELDTWTLYENVTYGGYAFSPHNCDVTTDGWITQAHYHAGIRFLKIQSPSEAQGNEWRIAGKRYETKDPGAPSKELDAGEEFSGVVGPGALGSTRETHEFTPEGNRVDAIVATLSYGANAQDNDLVLEKNVSRNPEDPEWTVVAESKTLGGPESIEARIDTGTLHRFVVETYANAAANYEISATYLHVPGKDPERRVAEEGLAYYRDHVEVPEESMIDSPMAPDFWSARHENGVAFCGDRNTGFYAVVADPIPVGTRTPVDVEHERSELAQISTGDETVRQEIDVSTDAPVALRDRVPRDWEVDERSGDVESTRDVGDGVEIALGAVDGDATVAYEATTGDDLVDDVVGPLEFSTDGGDTWEPIPDSTARSLTVGGV